MDLIRALYKTQYDTRVKFCVKFFKIYSVRVYDFYSILLKEK